MPMPQYTIIANVKNSVMFMESKSIYDNQFLAEIFSGDPKATEVKQLQIITPEFRDRVHLIKEKNERYYKFSEYFDQIPLNQHFLFISGHIDDIIGIYRCIEYLAQLDNVPLQSPSYEKIAPFLYENYEVRQFLGDERMRIGAYDKSQRVCRFCGRSMPEVTFKQKAHAISEALGNKGLICVEECDDCNKRFNETIEQDIIYFSQFNLLLYGVKGKHGIPTFKGDRVTITNNTSTRSTIGRDTMVLNLESIPKTHDRQELVKFLSDTLSSSSIEYVPQNIYKCLCKFVLSLINSKYIPYFKGTIDWINEPLSKHCLPPVWYFQVPMGSSPTMIIMQRKHHHKEIPYCWAILNIVGWQYLFIVPFCSLDKFKFVGKNRVDFFIEGIKNMMSNIELHPMNLDGIVSAKFPIKANFDISPECQEGRDYYFIDKNKNPEDWPVDILNILNQK